MKDSYESIEKVLQTAQDLLTGDRAREYGDPADAHRVISSFWTTYLGVEVTPQDVAIMLTLMKIARLKASPSHEDSMVDAVAYLAIAKAHQDESKNTVN